VVDGEQRIITGHGRYLAAVELKATEVPMVFP
jgi:ParB-like chromosome segregation protein Spo0J